MTLQSNEGSTNVALLGPESKEDAVSKIVEHRGIAGVKEAVPKFKRVKTFTTFDAEYSLDDGNVVVHFFMPSGYRVTQDYWKGSFAEVLEKIAPEHFQATQPRLVAKYTEDDGIGNLLNSWWFKAQGYAHVLDLDAFVMKFFEKMDSALDPAFQQHSKVKEEALQ